LSLSRDIYMYMGRKPTNITIEQVREQSRIRSNRYYHKHHAKKKCECHLYERQVCDICQKILGNEPDTI